MSSICTIISESHQFLYGHIAKDRLQLWIYTEVENALFRRAIGYEYDEVTYECGVETKRVRKHVVGDVTAQIYWLKNRRPDLWRDRRDGQAADHDESKGETGIVVIPQILEEDDA